MSEQTIQEERLALLSVLHELTVAALDLFDPRRSMAPFLERVAERMGCVAVLVLVEPTPGAPRLLDAAGLSAASRALSLPTSAPGAAAEAPRLPYPELSRPGHVVWRFPLDGAGESGAPCMLLCFDGEPPLASQHLGMMRRLVTTFSMALSHRDLYARAIESEREVVRSLAAEQAGRAAAEAAQRRAAFLSEASRLLSSSLNYEATLARVARLPVPLLADWCAVDIIEPDGGLRCAAVVHADRAKADLACRLEGRRPTGALLPGMRRALETGEPALCELAELPALSEVEPALAEVAPLGLCRYIIAPLVSRGVRIGALTIASGRNDLRYTTEDVSLADELGRRAALAIDNARLYDSAQRAIRAREDLVAVVSHDLKSPLSTVVMNVGLLSRKLPPPDVAPDLRRPIDRIQRSADRMKRLICDLLDLAKLDGGHLTIHAAPQDVTGLIVEALELFREEAAGKSLRVLHHVSRGVSCVLCDRERVLQVLGNLVGNAIKFTPSGGQVAVGAELRGAEVVVSVHDTGPGIPEDQRARIFDRYWQAKATAHKGTGLGLSIAKGLVELHGGRIWVESAVGAGSTFYFALPAVAPASVIQVPPLPPTVRGNDIARNA